MQTVLVCQYAHLTLDFEFKTNTQDCLGLMSLLINYNKWKDEDELSTYVENVYLTSTLVDLVDMIEKPEGVHNINTKLFSISFPQLRSLQKLALESTNFDYSSAEYRVIAIILDIANYRLFRPVRSDVPAEKPKHFMKIKFLNKAVDAINLPALLRSTSVTDKIPVYFRDKEPPIVSYEYTSTVASKLFNFAPTLSNLHVSEYLSNSQTCQCKKSKFCYEPHGHVITGDLRVIENAKLRELVAKGPKYREPNRVNWKATETMFLESIDLYAKNWSKREQVELKYLSEWKDQLKELVTDRISNLNYMPIMFWSQQTKLPIM